MYIPWIIIILLLLFFTLSGKGHRKGGYYEGYCKGYCNGRRDAGNPVGDNETFSVDYSNLNKD